MRKHDVSSFALRTQSAVLNPHPLTVIGKLHAGGVFRIVMKSGSPSEKNQVRSSVRAAWTRGHAALTLLSLPRWPAKADQIDDVIDAFLASEAGPNPFDVNVSSEARRKEIEAAEAARIPLPARAPEYRRALRGRTQEVDGKTLTRAEGLSVSLRAPTKPGSHPGQLYGVRDVETVTDEMRTVMEMVPASELAQVYERASEAADRQGDVEKARSLKSRAAGMRRRGMEMIEHKRQMPIIIKTQVWDYIWDGARWLTFEEFEASDGKLQYGPDRPLVAPHLGRVPPRPPTPARPHQAAPEPLKQRQRATMMLDASSLLDGGIGAGGPRARLRSLIARLETRSVSMATARAELETLAPQILAHVRGT